MIAQPRTVHPGCSGPGSPKGDSRPTYASVIAWRERITRTFGEAVAAKVEAVVYPGGL